MQILKFNENKENSTMEKDGKKQEIEDVSDTEESDITWRTDNFTRLNSKNKGIKERVLHYIQMNHVIGKPQMNTTRAQKNLNNSKVKLIVDLNIFYSNTSVDAKLVKLKRFVQKFQ